MPRLKNANHEKIAREYVRQLNDKGKVIQGDIYSKVYRNATPLSASAQASRLINQPQMQLRISEIIAQKNTPEEISADLAELRRAKKEVFDPEGNIVEIRDNQTRISAVQTVLKTMNAFNEPVTENKTINFNINSMTSNGMVNSLLNAIDKLAGLNDKLGVVNNT